MKLGVVMRSRDGGPARRRVESTHTSGRSGVIRMVTGNHEEAKLFVAGLTDATSEAGLRELFESTGGKVVNVSLPKDRATGRPRGFGFVTMATPAEAEAARTTLDGSFHDGRSISVRPFQAEPPRRDAAGGPPSAGPRSSGPRSVGGGPQQSADKTLYVGNLPYDCNPQEVEALVAEAAGEGQVVRVHLPMDPDGRKRGFGFVTMASSEAAKAASEKLRDTDFRGRRLIVNIAHPKGDRPPRSEQGFGGGGGGGGFGGGGGGFGGPPPSGFGPPSASFGAPPPSRRTFDADRKRRGAGATAGASPFEDGPRKKRHGGRDRSHDPDRWDDDD